mgnify:CR=1 FL=1
MANFTAHTPEQLAAHDAATSKRYLEALREVQAENAQLRIGSARYEKLRKLNAEQFALLYRANINTGIHFDTLVDALGETK